MKKFDNKSDPKWKSKSLNALQIQQYQISLKDTKKSVVKEKQTKKDPKKDQKLQATTDKGQPKQEFLPSPKISKIKHDIFCISLDNMLNVFYMPDVEEKAKMKPKKTFGKLFYSIDENIEFVSGNNTNFMFVGSKNNLTVLEVNQVEHQINLICKKNVPDLRIVTALGNELIAVSKDKIYQYSVRDKYDLVAQKKIQFANEKDEKLFSSLKAVGIVVSSIKSLFYFGTTIEDTIDTDSLKGFVGEQPRLLKSQSLYIVKLSINHSIGQSDNAGMTVSQIAETRISSITASIFQIDHIFQLGIFNQSKIYQIQEETFLMSLHEEIILIKFNFNKYIVWDNVSVVSSKSQSKKGQLILADKKIMVYSEGSQIYAHQIFFNDDEQKLNMPAIDNFKGNDNDEEVLYDAILLEYENKLEPQSNNLSLMKVLVYVKPKDLVHPNNESNLKRIQTDPNKIKEESTTLNFSIMCITQSDPIQKLTQLLGKGKPASEIQIFCRRFNISTLQKTKSMWSVSQKKLIDIQNILLQINDDAYIKTELDNILKKEPHSLSFLGDVEARQIVRLKKLLVSNLLAHSQLYDQSDGEKKFKLGVYINEIIRWLMESIMFQKKINYSKQFLTFKEYDFIEIGKLKAASLKEEIKLLSCKKYQKRLKYFLHSFKVLAIANFEQVFEFLLADKNQSDIQNFLKQFRFILPNFVETSQVFINQKEYKVFTSKIKTKNSTESPGARRSRAMSFSRSKNEDLLKTLDKVKQEEKERQNILWDDNKEIKEEGFPTSLALYQAFESAKNVSEKSLIGPVTETMEYFEAMIICQIEAVDDKMAGKSIKARAITQFKEILSKFQKSSWFVNNAFKQHAMITKTTKQLEEQYKQLQRKGVFKILMRFLYRNIDKKIFNKASVTYMVNKFVEEKLVPQSFKKNVDARIKIYEQILQKLARQKKDLYLLPLQDFIVEPEQKYFYYLFNTIRSRILTQVKLKYDQVETGFFQERIQIFFKSNEVTPDMVIGFLDEFNQNISADAIRLDVFTAIKRLLKLSDAVNTQSFIDKSMEKEILPERENDENPLLDSLREQAKIPYGFFFFHFFKAFDLDYTYEQLIAYTQSQNISQNKLIQQIVEKYCANRYRIEEKYGMKETCVIRFDQTKGMQELPDVDIYNQPLEFFGIVLHLLDQLDFQLDSQKIFQLMMERYLVQGKFVELKNFIIKLKEYHLTQKNLRTKNYLMISDFKEQNDVENMFIQYVIEWVKRTYQSMSYVQELDSNLMAIDRSLTMISDFNRSSAMIRKEKAFYKMLTYIKCFDPRIITRVQYLKEQISKQSGFIFMMHLFKEIGVDKFADATKNEVESDKVENFYCIFQGFKETTNLQKIQYDDPEFLRILIEICIKTIEANKFTMAKYLLLNRIPNQKFYFNDVLYLFVALLQRDEKNASNFNQDIVKLIFAPETTSLIKNNLGTLLNKYEVKKFVDDRFVQQKRCRQMFELIYNKKQRDDAFFFLIRAKLISNSDIRSVVILQNQRIHSYDDYEKQRKNVEKYAFLVLSSYMKSLQSYIQDQFYPSYHFFVSKFRMLNDQKDRKDIIKDVNLALSKLQRKIQNQQQKKQDQNKILLLDLQKAFNELKKAYHDYMNSIGQDPQIKLTYDQENVGKRLDAFTREKPKNLFEEESKQEGEAKKQLQKNADRVNYLQQDNRLNVVNKQVSERITEIRKISEKQNQIEAEMKKKDKNQISLAEKKAKQIQKIKQKEKDQIQSIKDTYKSNTTQKVNQLLANLKAKRQKIQERKGGVRDSYVEPSALINNHNAFNELIRPSSPRTTERMMTNLMPTTMKGRLNEPINDGRREFGERDDKQRLLQIQKRVFNNQEPAPKKPQSPTKKKLNNFEHIQNLYRESQSQQALKNIEKYDLLKATKARIELIKRVYTITNNLQNFLEFLKFLLLDESWKEAIEQKSVQIVYQMVKMNQKSKLNLKQIIPADYFTTVHKVSLKDYYTLSFEIFKPNLKKIFENELMAVHAVGILFRYSHGNQNKFYNKIFEEYYKVLLRNYELKTSDEKETFYLAEKLRTNYANLPQNREQRFEGLLNSISSAPKKARLIEALKKAIQRKGESLIGGQSNKQIGYVLQRISK